MSRGSVVLVGPARFCVDPPFAGGLEAFVSTLASVLRRRGHDVVVVAGVRPAVRRDRRRDVPSDAGEATADGVALRDAVAQVVHRADVQVIHNNSSAPQVLDLVGSVPTFETTLHTPPLAELRCLGALADEIGLCTPSPSNAEAWRHYLGVSPDVVSNGVDRSVFRPGRRGRPYLAWAGRIVAEKGLHVALDAAALLEMPLLFAGPVHDRDYFDALIVPRLGRHARYQGHLGPARLSRLLAGASATLVTPLWPEPFGLVVVESLACGTPVAALANGSLDHRSSGCFHEDVVASTTDLTAAGLAAAVLGVLGMPAHECRAATDRFDLEGMVSCYEQRYGLVPASSGAPAA
jgi:glycosyltransferase involved in cell wall biosynthesis